MTVTKPISKEGLLLINKEEGKTSFSLIPLLRKVLSINKIGHAGTLDPFATGVMIFLIGRNYTRAAKTFLNFDKEYIATLKLGQTTTSYDREGDVVSSSSIIPSKDAVVNVLKNFQGNVEQIPPMFSAKKVNGKPLYKLARKGITIERSPIAICIKTTLMHYDYPHLDLHIQCTSGTYIRSIAHDMGQYLGCGASLYSLKRIRVGPFLLQDCIDQKKLCEHTDQMTQWIKSYPLEKLSTHIQNWKNFSYVENRSLS